MSKVAQTKTNGTKSAKTRRHPFPTRKPNEIPAGHVLSGLVSNEEVAGIEAYRRHLTESAKTRLDDVRESGAALVLAARVYSKMPWDWLDRVSALLLSDEHVARIKADEKATAHFISLMALSVGLEQAALDGGAPPFAKKEDPVALAFVARCEAYRKLEGYGDEKILERVARVLRRFLKVIDGLPAIEMFRTRLGGCPAQLAAKAVST